MSKVSNIQLLNGQTLMDLALSELDKRFAKIVAKKKGTFKFSFQYADLNDKNKIIEYKIDVKFENRGWGKDGGYMKQKFRNHYIIFVNTCTSVEETWRNVYVHEITHVSQKLNNFLEYSYEHQTKNYEIDIVKKRKKSKVNRRKYYLNRHSESLTEQEAQLVTILQLLKEDKIKSAISFMVNRPDYFYFEWREFIQKAYAYGVSKETIIKAKEYMMEIFNTDIMECEKMNNHNVWSNYFHRFIQRKPLMGFFGLGNKYWKSLYELGNKISEPQFRMETNIAYVKKQLEIV
jgi:hypothetical protein